jgi:hypothetical protein
MTLLAGSSKLLRAMNESATLALLLERGTLTRAELRDLVRYLTSLGHAKTGTPADAPAPDSP